MKYGLKNEEPVIRTFSGKWVNVFEPKKDSIVIEDIAHALSNLCRFGGHPPKHYSVGQHSVHCCQMIKREHKFAALLHDASEAYMVDIPSPIKRNLANYKEIEDGLMKVIAEVFGFQYPFHKDIHTVDNLMLQIEWDNIFEGKKTVPDFTFYSPEKSKKEFIQLFNIYKK